MSHRLPSCGPGRPARHATRSSRPMPSRRPPGARWPSRPRPPSSGTPAASPGADRNSPTIHPPPSGPPSRDAGSARHRCPRHRQCTQTTKNRASWRLSRNLRTLSPHPREPGRQHSHRPHRHRPQRRCPALNRHRWRAVRVVAVDLGVVWTPLRPMAGGERPAAMAALHAGGGVAPEGGRSRRSASRRLARRRASRPYPPARRTRGRCRRRASARRA